MEQEKESHAVWKELDALVDEDTKEHWIELEKLAMEHRGHHLNIYQVNLPEGKFYP